LLDETAGRPPAQGRRLATVLDLFYIAKNGLLPYGAAMTIPPLTRRQREILDYLRRRGDQLAHPPTLSELCDAMGLSSKGSMHKQVQALVDAGLVEPMNHQRRGIRLAATPGPDGEIMDALPMLGYIAAGHPIEAVTGHDKVSVPPALHRGRSCYVLRVKGDSMVDEGILDGDWVVIEEKQTARNGEIVVALIDDSEATLKRIEQRRGHVILHPANPAHKAQQYDPERVRIQGVLVGQMRRYH
jgi:repressor LexA